MPTQFITINSPITKTMTAKGTHAFQVNLGGVLEVLSNHLYSSERVFIRELLQNACDAIVARQLKSPDWKEGEIHLELIAEAEQVPLLVIEDNGIGLNESEVRQFLSSIGASTKRDYFTNNRDQFIGQFGIGLLSCFMVSDQITLVTRAAGHAAIKWVGKVDGTYDLFELDEDLDVGTKVYLSAKNDKHDLFNARSLQRLIKFYGEILPFPIHFSSTGDKGACLNAQAAVWEQSYLDKGTRRLEYLEYGRQSFDIQFQDYIEINLPEFGAEGIVYLLPFAANPNSKPSHKVFLKRMLLSKDVDNLVPEWCFFVKAVLNVQNLRPTASRESFYEDENLLQLRDAIGSEVRRYLFDLAESDPAKLSKILEIHEQAFKQMALADDEFFQLIVPFLHFSTTKGSLMLKEIQDEVIRHVPNVDEFRKIAPVASSKGLTLINSGYTYDATLLRKLSQLDYSKPVEQINANSFLEIFEDLDPGEKEGAQAFMRVASIVLAAYKCKPEIKKYSPNNLPMLYYMTQSVEHNRFIQNAMDQSNNLWSGILGSFASEIGKSDFSVLCFNLKNPVIQRLVKLEDEELLGTILSILYVNALLLGHHPVNIKEMNLLNTNIINVVDWITQR